MKLVRFESAGGKCGESWGVFDQLGIHDLGALLNTCPTLLDAIRDWENLASRINDLLPDAPKHDGDIPLLSPVQEAGKTLCIGLNYRDHALETGAEIPTEPVVFNKLSGTLCGPGTPIPLPQVSRKVDYEAELVIVIGRRAWCVNEDEAEDYVFGYMCGHDVSARDWQKGKPGGQWLLGKSFPHFAPVGPWLVTKNEIRDACDLRIQMRINDEVMQDSNTGQLIFNPRQLIAYISKCCILQPGDLIFTGTPPGVGAARKPPRFLRPGDVCEVEVEGLGILRNPVIQAETTLPLG